MRVEPSPMDPHAERYRCEFCGKVYVVPSLARDCENADLDDPSRLVTRQADAAKP